MPKGLLTSSNVQINYLSARGHGKLYLALTNQSKSPVTSTLRLNSELLKLITGQVYSAKVWKDNKPTESLNLKNNEISVEVSAEGITALAIEGITVNPVFQLKLTENAEVWKKDTENLEFGGGSTAVLFNFGPDLQSVYTFTKATGDSFSKVTLHYACNGKWASITKESYPFEFTVELPQDTREFKYRYEGFKKDGKATSSKEGILVRQ